MHDHFIPRDKLCRAKEKDQCVPELRIMSFSGALAIEPFQNQLFILNFVFMFFKFCFAIMLVLMSLFDSCFRSPIEQAITRIDVAIDAINKNSSQWQTIVSNLATDMPKEVHNIIGNDLTSLSRDFLGSASIEFKCNVDFMKARVRNSLQNLKAKLTGEKVYVARPAFCSVNPSSINPNLTTSPSMNTLHVYGYDFNNTDPANRLIQAVLIGDSSHEFIEDKYIGHVSNYELIINASALFPIISKNKFYKIQLLWNGDSIDLPQVLLQKWTAETKTEFFTPTEFSWIPPFTGAHDKDFNTKASNHADGNVKMRYNIQPGYIEASVYLDAMEIGGDNTRVGFSAGTHEESGWSDYHRIYTVSDPKFEIQSFTQNLETFQPFSIDRQGPVPYFQSGPISRYNIDIDHDNDDAGSYSKVTVFFNQLSVVLVHKTD